MKVLSTEGLTKLIDLIKSNFISNEDTQATTAVDAVETSEVTLATVATTGSYNDLIDKPSSRNIGEVITSTIPLSDAGLHLLDGSLIQSGVYTDFVDYIAGLVSDYPDLFVSENDWQTAVTTYGVCGKFVYDSTNNTVRLPKITGFIEGTTDVTALGDLVEAGLPNITGSVSSKYYITDNQTTSGVFKSISGTGQYGTAQSSVGYGFTFDASQSSSIYGNSTTVQPQAIKVLYYIVMATSTKTDIEVDIDDIITDLNSKVSINQMNTILSTLYPVGSVYIGTQSTCPLATLISGSTWELVSEGRVLQGSDSNHIAGSTIAAGLPNITGTVPDPIGGNAGTWTGAFARGSYAGSITASSVDYDGYNISFNASRSSSIYGNSSTVQPPAYVVNIWRRTA